MKSKLHLTFYLSKLSCQESSDKIIMMTCYFEAGTKVFKCFVAIVQRRESGYTGQTVQECWRWSFQSRGKEEDLRGGHPEGWCDRRRQGIGWDGSRRSTVVTSKGTAKRRRYTRSMLKFWARVCFWQEITVVLLMCSLVNARECAEVVCDSGALLLALYVLVRY